MAEPMTDPTPTRDEAVRAALSDALFWLEGALQCDKFEWSADQGSLATDALERGRAALASALAPASGDVDAVAVKALLWNEYETEGEVDRWDAETATGTYYEINREFDGYYLSHDHLSQSVCPFDSPYAAKAAAQADYEQRIRSALSPAATPVSEAGGEAGDVWVLFSDGHPLFLSGSKHTAESARKGYAEDGKHTDGPFRYALAKPASSPAGGDVREAAMLVCAEAVAIGKGHAMAVSKECIEHLRTALSQSTSAGRVGE